MQQLWLACYCHLVVMCDTWYQNPQSPASVTLLWLQNGLKLLFLRNGKTLLSVLENQHMVQENASTCFNRNWLLVNIVKTKLHNMLSITFFIGIIVIVSLSSVKTNYYCQTRGVIQLAPGLHVLDLDLSAKLYGALNALYWSKHICKHIKPFYSIYVWMTFKFCKRGGNIEITPLYMNMHCCGLHLLCFFQGSHIV